MFFLYMLPLHCSLIYAVCLENFIGFLALLMLWTLVVVCHRQPAAPSRRGRRHRSSNISIPQIDNNTYQENWHIRRA
jgi:hypothetical protein